MISLPTLPTGTAEKPVKTAASAGIDGAFASILEGETGSAKLPGGKNLPEGGKDLPEGLPAETMSKQIAGKAFAQVHAKFELKAQPKAEPEQTADASAETDGDTAEAADAPKADVAATADSAVVAAIALAVQMPVKLASEPRAEHKPVKDHTEQAEPAAENAKPIRAELALSPAPVRNHERGARTLLSPFRTQTALATRSEKPAPVEAPPASEQAVATAETAETATAPVTTQDAVRPARPVRAQARHEVTLDVVKEAKATQAEQAAPRAAIAASVLDAAQPAQPIATDPTAAPADQGAKPVLAAAQQAVRPHEFTALVDRLVEAREAARPADTGLTVMHAEFGQVSVNFGQDNGNLTVSLASNDPGFIPAVNAATAADGANNGDANFQGRRDDGGQGARAGDGSSMSSGQGGSGREGSARQFRDSGIMQQQPRFAGANRRAAPNGIFA